MHQMPTMCITVIRQCLAWILPRSFVAMVLLQHNLTKAAHPRVDSAAFMG
ncbi:MAG: hypothetical protein IJ552_09015 [Prevotella sp.]|nr:hypothetical protein [Prevotella sp.]MBQ8715330.1 hypothetical protein [Prevotella sp.]